MKTFHTQPADHRALHIAQGIHAVQSAAYTQEARWLGMNVRDFPPAQRSVDDIRHSNEHFIIAVDGHSLVGAIGVETPDIAVWLGQPLCSTHIASLAVLPERQREGIARHLVQEVIASHLHSPITVSTAAANFAALGLYAQLGFVQHERGFIQCAGQPLELILLRRELPTSPLRA